LIQGKDRQFNLLIPLDHKTLLTDESSENTFGNING
jgi:hypothetical protein